MPEWIRPLAVAVCLALASACSDPDLGTDADAAAEPTDASGECIPGNLEIGRCAVGDGSSCTGVEAEQPRFAALANGGEVPMTIGFQGALMVPLAVRTSGIYPGTDAEPSGQPRVEAALIDTNDQQVSAYQNRALFTAVNGDPDTFEWLYVFMLIPGASDDIAGQSFTIDVTVRDRDGITRCDVQTLVAGSM